MDVQRGSEHFLGAFLGAFSKNAILKWLNHAGYSELFDSAPAG
jgi:hypothetical protein